MYKFRIALFTSLVAAMGCKAHRNAAEVRDDVDALAAVDLDALLSDLAAGIAADFAVVSLAPAEEGRDAIALADLKPLTRAELDDLKAKASQANAAYKRALADADERDAVRSAALDRLSKKLDATVAALKPVDPADTARHVQGLQDVRRVLVEMEAVNARDAALEKPSVPSPGVSEVAKAPSEATPASLAALRGVWLTDCFRNATGSWSRSAIEVLNDDRLVHYAIHYAFADCRGYPAVLLRNQSLIVNWSGDPATTMQVKSAFRQSAAFPRSEAMVSSMNSTSFCGQQTARLLKVLFVEEEKCGGAFMTIESGIQITTTSDGRSLVYGKYAPMTFVGGPGSGLEMIDADFRVN